MNRRLVATGIGAARSAAPAAGFRRRPLREWCCLILPVVALAAFALFQPSPAAAQASCVREGAPFTTGNRTLVNGCKRTVTVTYFDQLQCRQGSRECTLALAGGKAAVISTPGPRGIEWIACWERSRPRLGAGGRVVCE